MTPADLSRDPEAVRVRKRPTTRAVTFAARDGRCATLEGEVPYRAGDAIVTGAVGERWPVTREHFLASYDPVPPLVSGEDGLYAPRPVPIWARRLDRPACVPLAGGGELAGEAGDWLLQYDDRSRGIVRADIFAETYEPA